MIEVQLPDGTILEFPDNTSQDVMRNAIMSLQPATAQKNPDGTYGQAPEGMIANPMTGQMTNRSMLGAQTAPTQADAAMGGTMQGLSFRMGDELMGLGGLIEGGPEMGAFRREQARGTLEAQQAAYPWTYGGGEIGGGIATSLAGGQALGLQAAPTLGGRAVQGAGMGAVEGALFGFGGGEGVVDRGVDAATMGTIGGLVGAAAPYAVQGVRTGFDRAVGGPVASMRSAPSQVRASQAVQTALDRSGKTVDDVTAALTAARSGGQPEYMIADALGNPGQRMLSGIARQPGNARTEITDFLTNRQTDQGRRIAGALDKNFNGVYNPDNLPVPYGVDPSPNLGKTAQQVTTRLEDARTAAADVAYPAARADAGPVNLQGPLEAIDGALRGVNSIDGGTTGLAETAVGRRLASLRGQLESGNYATINFDEVLETKQELGRAIAAIKKRGESVPPAIGKVYGELDKALEASSNGYRAANDGFRQASRVIDAVDQGTTMAGARARVGDNLQTYGGMTPDQQAAARAGYIDPIIGKIENAAPGVNNARPLLSPGFQAEAGAMARNPQELADFIRREQTMFETGTQAMGGSRTADNLADIQDVQGFDVGPILNILAGRPGAAIQQVAGKAGNALMGRNTATREEIARLLLSPDLQAALQPALRKQLAVGKQSQVVEALMRGLERAAVGD